MAKFLKSGQFIDNNINEIHVEPDGSRWMHVFHHCPINGTNLFSSTDDFVNGVYKNKDAWFNFQICNKITNEWEFLHMQKLTQRDKNFIKHRWKQTVNPFNATYADVSPSSGNINRNINEGYVNGGFGGLYKFTRSSRTFFSIANNSNTTWYGATGSWTAYQGGIPGYPNSVITTGCVDIYIRIDSLNDNTVKFYKTGIQTIENIYEY